MNTKILIEAFGYLGSLLVLVSMLMTSVVKLRIINTIGSIIFTIYAFIIRSYPTAFMNLALVIINLHFLWKMNQVEKEYDIIEANQSDVLLNYLLELYREDIEKCFPGLSYDKNFSDRFFIVMCQGKPVGITAGHKENDCFVLDLDYTIQEYRDFSIGSYLFNYLKKNNIQKVLYRGPVAHHKEYLNRLNFKETKQGYIKEL